jgi:hypothetical protein
VDSGLWLPSPKDQTLSKAAKWGIPVGVFIALLGLVVIASGFTSRQSDPAPLAAGLAVFASGLLTIAASFYIQARAIRAKLPSESNVSAPGKRKHLCDVCRTVPAVILCTMHKTSLCPSCLAGHYDSRGCVYVPANRRTNSRPARGAAASRG